MPTSLIALASDFGLHEPYVACMKGVIFTICPHASLIDLGHELPPFDVGAASEFLGTAVSCLPSHAIVVAVVDPGVGTARRGVVARTHDGLTLIAPDNGLLSAVLEARGLAGAFELVASEWRCPGPVSATFHGRDIFAPAAAHLALGVAPERFGPAVEGLVRLPRPGHLVEAGGRIRGCVARIDSFGNVITSIPAAALSGLGIVPGAATLSVLVAGHALQTLPFALTYGVVPPGTHLALIGSNGHLELATRESSFAAQFPTRRGTEVLVTRAP